MQKVVCPMTIVQSESEMPLKLKKAFSATAVMMPGRARGRTNSRLTVSRPKKVVRWIAKAAHEPSTSATPVAVRPASTDSSSASRTW